MAGLLSWRRDRSASLFERIQERETGFSGYSRSGDLLASIKQNLNQVLNSHPGGSQSAPQLGVIDLNDATASSSDFRQAIEDAIRNCIIHYEPRISRVDVSAGRSDEQDPLTLSFHILAHVDFDDIDDVVEFNIHLDNHQRYHLS
ncbi:type VI secretion system baseplate subunit TssE [Enterobacillus tribolii]|uniref:Type VI secretion system protein n=1 Tax=Enterobacillus tribolii TaxID=1487935 RepID=A0A370QHC1_9GAMM|nr:type VI secretion system baseplate subunit TssE [Enterobacillus tribolii]MBW7982475.1 type VI secretion system baseplate subunit TssE [Enterobacillus tribolii]RDK87754.1 type VI secretion system protein [Enterobacillus tribolii]